MSKLENRVDNLERNAGVTGNEPTAVYVQFVRPGNKTPVGERIGLIEILNGGRFVRSDFDGHDAFLAAANACHLETFETPLQLAQEAGERTISTRDWSGWTSARTVSTSGSASTVCEASPTNSQPLSMKGKQHEQSRIQSHGAARSSNIP